MEQNKWAIHWLAGAVLSVDATTSVEDVVAIAKQFRPAWIVFLFREEYYVISARELHGHMMARRSLKRGLPALVRVAHRAIPVPSRSKSITETETVDASSRIVGVHTDGSIDSVGRLSKITRSSRQPQRARTGVAKKRASKRVFSLVRGIRHGGGGRNLRRSRTSYRTVPIFFATDRLRADNSLPKLSFVGERCTDGKLQYGTCNVTIPHHHRMGEIESPRFWRFEFTRDAEKHVTILSSKPLSAKSFYKRVLDRANGSTGEAFVFVHGYNVSFENAVMRTAQIAHDLQFKGAPILFSWPSKGRFWSYTADEATVDWSRAHFQQFLSALAAKAKLDAIHVIAHSMGNRIVMRALESVSVSARKKDPQVNHVVLTAPDIDAGEFLQIARSMRSISSGVTLYSSSHDTALKASRRFHSAPRAGESGRNLVVMPGIDTIDASAADTSLMAHSYFAKKRSVLSDVFYLFRNSPPAQRHGLEQMSHANGAYWAMKA
jgi:esterase/lipase superfamily enzyme